MAHKSALLYLFAIQVLITGQRRSVAMSPIFSIHRIVNRRIKSDNDNGVVTSGISAWNIFVGIRVIDPELVVDQVSKLVIPF